MYTSLYIYIERELCVCVYVSMPWWVWPRMNTLLLACVYICACVCVYMLKEIDIVFKETKSMIVNFLVFYCLEFIKHIYLTYPISLSISAYMCVCVFNTWRYNNDNCININPYWKISNKFYLNKLCNDL